MTLSLFRDSGVPALPKRPADGHKGTFGRVLIIGGSRGMSGAPSLSGMSALRGGAGLVYLAIPKSVAPIVAGFDPSYLTIPLDDDADGRISREAIDSVLELLPQMTAVAIGPGLGKSESLKTLVRAIYQSTPLPVVLDADALNLLAEMRDVLFEPGGPRILTPHPGEFSRLTGKSMDEVQEQRESLAAEFARLRKIVVVLKGPRTVVTDGTRIDLNTTGNSGMATGGTGDVLTGLTAAVLGQGLPAYEAARFAVYLHGLAGDLAADELSEPGMIASDLPKYLSKAWKAVSARKKAETGVG
jgi:ADP-dependent NAD(P)H-hydrate dehydratase